MERAEPGVARGAVEVDRLVRAFVDAQRGLDGAATIARVHGRVVARAAAGDFGEAVREQQSYFVEADVAAPSAAACASSPSTISSGSGGMRGRTCLLRESAERLDGFV